MYCKQNSKDADCSGYTPQKSGACGMVKFSNSLTKVDMEGVFETTDYTNKDDENHHHLFLKTTVNIDKRQIPDSSSFSTLPLEKQTLGHRLIKLYKDKMRPLGRWQRFLCETWHWFAHNEEGKPIDIDRFTTCSKTSSHCGNPLLRCKTFVTMNDEEYERLGRKQPSFKETVVASPSVLLHPFF